MTSMFKGKKAGDNEPDWNPTFEPVMKTILGKKGIKTKSAGLVGSKKVDYFRGKDFTRFLLDNENLVKKKMSAALLDRLGDKEKAPKDEKEAEEIGKGLIEHHFCYKARNAPIGGSNSGDKTKPKRWPDRLQKNPHDQKFTSTSEDFYVIVYEGSSGMQHFLLALIIVGVLLACMFPVWPMWAKIGIWYLSVIFLSLYFGVLILRMLIFTLFWIVGFDFWIFPNLNDEYCGFLDSFQPLYSWEKRKDDALMLLVRFSSLAMTALAVQQIAETHSLADVQDFVTSSYVDILDWGVDKLTALPGSDRQALPSVESLMREMENNESNATCVGDNCATKGDAITEEEDDTEEPTSKGEQPEASE